MKEILYKYLPEAAVQKVFELIQKNGVHLKIVPKRQTRHGDYRRMPNGQHQITVNSSGNAYRFLITTLHEIAHLIAFEKYGRNIKPHGNEWKLIFQRTALPFLHPDVFPAPILGVFAHHLKNPKASSDTDIKLAHALSQFDAPTDKNRIFELPEGTIFLTKGRRFKKGKTRVKRIECLEVSTARIYLFHPMASVEIETTHS